MSHRTGLGKTNPKRSQAAIVCEALPRGDGTFYVLHPDLDAELDVMMSGAMGPIDNNARDYLTLEDSFEDAPNIPHGQRRPQSVLAWLWRKIIGG